MRFRRPRHGTVAAYLALFVALGGTGYAAATLPRNSVGHNQMKKNAVTSRNVKNRSLLSVDFKSGQLPKGATGATGATGPAGPAGPTGPAGPAAGVGFANVTAGGAVDPPTSSGIGTANISNPAVGLYCISGLSPAPKNVQVTRAERLQRADQRQREPRSVRCVRRSARRSRSG